MRSVNLLRDAYCKTPSFGNIKPDRYGLTVFDEGEKLVQTEAKYSERYDPASDNLLHQKVCVVLNKSKIN